MNKDEFNIEIVSLDSTHVKGIYIISDLSFHVPWSEDSIKSELKNRFARYVVALKNDTVIGFAGVWVIIDEGHITNIAVHPDYRGLGIGNKLMESIIEICRNEKVYGMTLEVRASNKTAQNLYLKYGFKNEGIRKKYYEDNKEDAIIMWKRDF